MYIACKPTSLARDLEMIQGRGYKVEKISGVDLFPGTYHCEVVCCLHRVNSVEVLNFRHFARYMSFTPIGKQGKKKQIMNGIEVSVVLHLV